MLTKSKTSWADINDEELKKNGINDEELKKNGINDEELKKNGINDEEIKKNGINDEIKEENNTSLPFIKLSINVFDLYDGDKTLINTNQKIIEITKIIIGRHGYFLKDISIKSDVIGIWCRTSNDLNENNLNNRYFDVTILKEYKICSYQIVYWMLKKRVNIVINNYLQRNK